MAWRGRRGPRIKQAVRWEALTDTAIDAVAADTVTSYTLAAGTDLMAAASTVDIGTIRQILLYLMVLQGATAGIFHCGILVGSALDPRTEAEDSHWMWWWTHYLGAATIFQPLDFVTVPIVVRVKRVLRREDVLRFVYVNTEASSVLVQTRVLVGAGLERR